MLSIASYRKTIPVYLLPLLQTSLRTGKQAAPPDLCSADIQSAWTAFLSAASMAQCNCIGSITARSHYPNGNGGG